MAIHADGNGESILTHGAPCQDSWILRADGSLTNILSCPPRHDWAKIVVHISLDQGGGGEGSQRVAYAWLFQTMDEDLMVRAVFFAISIGKRILSMRPARMCAVCHGEIEKR